MQERLSPVGADIKTMRRDAKRSFSFALAGVYDPALTAMESPTKKAHAAESSVSVKSEGSRKGSKATKSKSATAAAATAAANAKRKAIANTEVAALQDAVNTIQQQVIVASNGIRELQQLVNVHLQARSRAIRSPIEVSTHVEPAPVKCVSPPAAIMAFDGPESGDMFDLLADFPEIVHHNRPQDMNSLLLYSGTPMPFSC